MIYYLLQVHEVGWIRMHFNFKWLVLLSNIKLWNIQCHTLVP